MNRLIPLLLAVTITCSACGSAGDGASGDENVIIPETSSLPQPTTTVPEPTAPPTTTAPAPPPPPPTTPPERPEDVEALAQQFAAGLLEGRVIDYLATAEARASAAEFLERDTSLDVARAAGRTGQDVVTMTCELEGDVSGTCFVLMYPANEADEPNGRIALWVSFATYDADEGFTLCEDFVTICNADGSEAAPGAARPVVIGVTDVAPEDS